MLLLRVLLLLLATLGSSLRSLFLRRRWGRAGLLLLRLRWRLRALWRASARAGMVIMARVTLRLWVWTWWQCWGVLGAFRCPCRER